MLHFLCLFLFFFWLVSMSRYSCGNQKRRENKPSGVRGSLWAKVSALFPPFLSRDKKALSFTSGLWVFGYISNGRVFSSDVPGNVSFFAGTVFWGGRALVKCSWSLNKLWLCSHSCDVTHRPEEHNIPAAASVPLWVHIVVVIAPALHIQKDQGSSPGGSIHLKQLK